MYKEPDKAFVERRQHKRYQLSDDFLVFNELTFGQIINLSKSGLAFRYLTTKGVAQDLYFELGILNSSNGSYLENIPCKTITSTDSAPIHPAGQTIIRRNGVQFGQLTKEQQKKIEEFLTERRGKIIRQEMASN